MAIVASTGSVSGDGAVVATPSVIGTIVVEVVVVEVVVVDVVVVDVVVGDVDAAGLEVDSVDAIVAEPDASGGTVDAESGESPLHPASHPTTQTGTTKPSGASSPKS
jgi:hypothetical protein